jgi:hypothetical protein
LIVSNNTSDPKIIHKTFSRLYQQFLQNPVRLSLIRKLRGLALAGISFAGFS